MRKARALARGEVLEGFVVHGPTELNVEAIRQKLDLSKEESAPLERALRKAAV